MRHLALLAIVLGLGFGSAPIWWHHSEAWGRRTHRDNHFLISVITRLLTQSVSLSILVIILSCSIWSNVAFSLLWIANGTLHGGWITGSASSLISILYSFSNCPIPVNTSLYSRVICSLVRVSVMGLTLTFVPDYYFHMLSGLLWLLMIYRLRRIGCILLFIDMACRVDLTQWLYSLSTVCCQHSSWL